MADESPPLPIAAVAPPDAANAAPPSESDDANTLTAVWVPNQVALAKSLGCSRKTVERFLKLEGKDAPPDPSSDGRYNVTAWKLWAQEHGRLQKQVIGNDKQSLELAGMRLANERKEIENAVRRGELMHVDEVCKVLTEMTGSFVAGARGMKHVLAPMVVGVSTAEATKRIGTEVDSTLTRLSLGEWAKKKMFWSKPYAHLFALHKRFSLGDGQSATS